MDEFADFYCAGSALDGSASPYTYEPLRTCEHRLNGGTTYRGRLFGSNAAVVVPAPQPAFDFAPFMLLAHLSPGTARTTYGAAIVVAVALSAAGLTVLGIPAALAAAALILSTLYVELNAGQIVPFALLALVACGVALSLRRDAAAGVAAALVLVEPTVGVPVVAATLLFVPRARIAAAATIVGLALLTWMLIGSAGVAQYVTGVLPAHAASEVHFAYQYSLTYAMASLGAPPQAARIAGVASYGVLLAAGLFIAPRSATALQRRELLAFVPALCALIGGPFLHQEELCFALPAVLVLACTARGRTRAIAAAALCVLSIPWIVVWGVKQLFLASAFVCVAALVRLRVAGWTAAAIVCAIAAVLYCFELRPPRLPTPTANALYAPTALAQREWRSYTDRRGPGGPLWFAIKVPEWAALIAAFIIAAEATPRSPGASESSRESLHETRRRPTGWPRARTDSDAGPA